MLPNIKINLFQEIKDYIFITLGVFLYAMGVTVFMLPYGLTTGGVAGIASIIYYATGLVEVQVTYVVINIILLIAAVKILGLKFCIKTIYGVGCMTFALWFCQRMTEVPDGNGGMMLQKLVGDEAFMACVLGAICDGIGLYICFEHNGSTGGTDIIAAIVNKYKQMSLGTVIMACDVIIISSCYFVFHDWYRVIYGFVLLFICSFTLDYCLNKRHQSVQFLIFSRNPEAIADAVVKTGRGVTVLDGEGWYTHSERKVLLTIVRSTEQIYIQRLIKSIDPYAFVSLSNANSVWGEGFDQMKINVEKQQKKKRTLVFASNSDQKLKEIRAILGDKYDVRSLADIGCYIDIPRKAGSIQGNALLKARFIKRYYGFDCIADDTALECKALNGMPGVYSSTYTSINDKEIQDNTEDLRYSEQYSDELSSEMLDILHINPAKTITSHTNSDVKGNIDKLIRNLENKDRYARLHTVVALVTGEYIDPKKNKTYLFDGILEGSIALQPSSEPKFFYDSVFIPQGYDKTYDELGIDIKNQISQRAIAVGKLKAFLEDKINK